MKKLIIPTLILLISSSAMAQIIQPKSKGMNYIKITKDPSEDKIKHEIQKEQAQEPEEPSQEIKDKIAKALEKPLIEKRKQAEKEKKEKYYFTKQEDLRKWGHLRALLSSSQKEQALAIKELEKAPDQASPMILLLASDFYFRQGNKEQAALYFLASKLRAEFDMKRWEIINESGLQSRKNRHPAKEVISLSQTLSNELSGWILSNKQRAQAILKKLEEWERETGYSYLPTYEVNSEQFNIIEKDKLIEIHADHLKDFIEKQNNTLSLIHPS